MAAAVACASIALKPLVVTSHIYTTFWSHEAATPRTTCNDTQLKLNASITSAVLVNDSLITSRTGRHAARSKSFKCYLSKHGNEDASHQDTWKICDN